MKRWFCLSLCCLFFPLDLFSNTLTPPLKSFCQKVENSFTRYGWKKGASCERYTWNHVRNSVDGNALPWVVFGKEEGDLKGRQVTLVLCGVHGDEITPIKFCFDIMEHLHQNYEKEYAGKLIVVAPVANPDAFFRARPTRFNSRGIDINRNFPTKDWNKEAHQQWKRERQDKRRFPGQKSLSEPETIFQVNLIKRYNPDKIISVHSPLTMLDYDGPTVLPGNAKEAPHQHETGAKAKRLLHQMSEMASNYRIKNFGIFPGSLGNWAGKERGIPTYTLELPTSDASKSDEYWELFKEAIHHAFLKTLNS